MKTIFVSGFFLTLVLAVNMAWGAETTAPPRVGSLREFDHYIFEGNHTYSARSLWQALNSTLDFAEVSHPAAPREPFLAAIQSDLLLGYCHQGFPNAQITTSYDPARDAVVVNINEGARFFSAPVTVTGVENPLASRIVKVLTVTNADSEDGSNSFHFLNDAPANRNLNPNDEDQSSQDYFWASGQPAYFDEPTLRTLTATVSNVLAQSGFLNARLQLSVHTNAAQRTARLEVKIIDHGPAAIINQIEVTGNQTNGRAVLLDYLGLKIGMKFTPTLAAAINDRLYHSGRFLTNSVSNSSPDAAGRLTLAINVVEVKSLPPLNEPLDPKEQTLLRARDWLAKIGDNQFEAVADITGLPDENSSLKCIISPHHGWLILDNQNVGGANKLRDALVLTRHALACYVPERKQKFAMDSPKSRLNSYISMETTAPDADGHYASLTCSAGFTNSDTGLTGPPCVLTMSLAPAGFVNLALNTNASCWIDKDQLIRSNATSLLKFDVSTGRLVEFIATSDSGHHEEFRLHFEPDTLKTAIKQIESDGADFKNLCQTNAPFSSALAFFGNEVLQLNVVDSFLRSRLPAAFCDELPPLLSWQKIENFAPIFEELKTFAPSSNDSPDSFDIPNPQPPPPSDANPGLLAISQWVLMTDDQILPPRSWPWTISRDTALLMRGQRDYLTTDLDELCTSGQMGPIGYLTLAEALQYLHLPTAKPVAAYGLQHLLASDFRRDYAPFLNQHYASGRLVARLGGALAGLNSQQLAGLTAPLSPAQAQLVRDCARNLQSAPTNQPLAENIGPALDTYWTTELLQNTTNLLRKIAEP